MTKENKEIKSVTIQHIGAQRQWTVPAKEVVKVYRGTAVVDPDHPRFKDSMVLLPGCIVDVVPELSKKLIHSRDFQKYGVEASR